MQKEGVVSESYDQEDNRNPFECVAPVLQVVPFVKVQSANYAPIASGSLFSRFAYSGNRPLSSATPLRTLSRTSSDAGA